MPKGRLEAFSDGVLAIIITIMVLELKVPHEAGFDSLRPLLGSLLGYLLSFLYVGIYWANHHHLFHAARHVGGGTLWANLHLLFWLSLVPFVTGWVGQTGFSSHPVAAYGVVLLMAAIAWDILRRVLIRCHGKGSVLDVATGRGVKEWVSLALYAIGIVLAFLSPSSGMGATGTTWESAAAGAMYALVAVIWLVPDRRITEALRRSSEGEAGVG